MQEEDEAELVKSHGEERHSTLNSQHANQDSSQCPYTHNPCRTGLRKRSALVEVGSGLSARKNNLMEARGRAGTNPLKIREIEDVKEQLLESNPVLEVRV